MAVCEPTTPCDPIDCAPIEGQVDCCPQSTPIAVPVCDMKVSIISCPTENRTVFPYGNDLCGDNLLCECVPCPDGLAFTDEQKAYIKQIFDGMLKVLSPYQRINEGDCCNELMPNTGHQFPIKPVNTRAGIAANGEDPLCQYPVEGAKGDCCNTFYKHSPFINGGGYQYRNSQQGGRPSAFVDLDQGGGSGVYQDKLGKLFCCAKDTIDSADTMVLAPATP